MGRAGEGKGYTVHMKSTPYLKSTRRTDGTFGRYIHRMILEKKLGRKLRPNEVTHHLNGIMDDNRPENLVAMTRSEHIRLHSKGRPAPWNLRRARCRKCGQLLPRASRDHLCPL